MRGSSVAELIVACGLFSVFMFVSVGLFTNMTRTVRSEQVPRDVLQEARVAALHVAQRVRNSQSLIRPKLATLLFQSSDSIFLRDRNANRALEIAITGGVLTETVYPIDFALDSPVDPVLLRRNRLTTAGSFRVESGGVSYPTRIIVSVKTIDGREVRAVTNFREAI